MIDLMVDDLEMSIGVGQARVTLPDEGRFRAKIDGAIGQTVIVIPAGLAARIRFSTVLVSRHLPAGYRHQSDVYVSPGYESANNRVDLDVNQAIGHVAIRHAMRKIGRCIGWSPVQGRHQPLAQSLNSPVGPCAGELSVSQRG